MEKKVYAVLIVDDSEDDRFFLRTALDRFPRLNLIGEARDGEEAIAYLSGAGPYRDRQLHPMPDLMLLDIQMPRKTGFEVLQWLRKQGFSALTVIVLSGSPLGQDVEASLALGASGFWTKTAEGEQQRAILCEIEEMLDRRHCVTAHP